MMVVIVTAVEQRQAGVIAAGPDAIDVEAQPTQTVDDPYVTVRSLHKTELLIVRDVVIAVILTDLRCGWYRTEVEHVQAKPVLGVPNVVEAVAGTIVINVKECVSAGVTRAESSTTPLRRERGART